MYVLDQYKNHEDLPNNFTDKQYLALQIWQLKNVFEGNLSAIKDINFNFVAVSEKYAIEFELNTNLQVNMHNIVFDTQKLFNSDIQEQEQALIDNQEVQDSLFLFKKNDSKSLSAYLMRKRPIVNPTTNQVVGIFIVAAKHKIGTFRTQFLKHLLSWNKKATVSIPSPDLTDEQQQIILCLLYGYHSRKEIAQILSENTSNQVNEIKIKNLLGSLYDKFECGTSSQLLRLITASQIKLEVPINSVEEGNYLF